MKDVIRSEVVKKCRKGQLRLNGESMSVVDSGSGGGMVKDNEAGAS